MSEVDSRRFSPFSLLTWGAVAALLVWFTTGHVLPHLAGARFVLRAPDWALLLRQSPAVLVHLFAVVPALVIGVWQLVGRKGTTSHRTLGWIWSVLMLVTAASSIFVRQLNHGAFSYIHLLSVYVLVMLPLAVWAARTHRVALHRRTMTGLVLGGTLIAGAFAVLPGRLIWAVFFG